MSRANNKPTRPWSRISIRVMMLIVLSIAALLAWRVNRARQQKDAVLAVERHGGWVHYDYEFVNGKLTKGRSPWAPRWLRRILGDEYFQNVEQVSLVYDDSTGTRFDNSNVEAADALLKRLSKLPGLKELCLQETQATDEGLKHIGKMTELERLFIWDGVSVTDAGVAHLAGLKNLKFVQISRSNLTDDSLALLSGLPRMESLSLQQNHFSDAGLARLSGQERLKRLLIGIGDRRVTDAGLAHLKGFKQLEVLDLQGSDVTARGLEQLNELPNLKKLWLGGTGIRSNDVQGLLDTVPNLMISGLQ
jgi:hypothetical protein